MCIHHAEPAQRAYPTCAQDWPRQHLNGPSACLCLLSPCRWLVSLRCGRAHFGGWAAKASAGLSVCVNLHPWSQLHAAPLPGPCKASLAACSTSSPHAGTHSPFAAPASHMPALTRRLQLQQPACQHTHPCTRVLPLTCVLRPCAGQCRTPAGACVHPGTHGAQSVGRQHAGRGAAAGGIYWRCVQGWVAVCGVGGGPGVGAHTCSQHHKHAGYAQLNGAAAPAASTPATHATHLPHAAAASPLHPHPLAQPTPPISSSCPATCAPRR